MTLVVFLSCCVESYNLMKRLEKIDGAEGDKKIGVMS